MHMKLKDYIKYSRNVKAMRAFRILKVFTRFNRVQLGRGLRDALEWLEYELNEKGPENLEANLIEVSTSNLPSSYIPPAEWTVHQAWFEVSGERRIDLESAPTLASAHSPPSDGIVEGKMKLIRDPLDPGEYEKAKGKIAVVTGINLPLAYIMAAEAGAIAVAYYRRDLPSNATPYSGLFLPIQLIKKYGIPAISLPYSIAARSEDKDARLLVDTDLVEASRVPILELTVLGRDEADCEGLASAVAHACHPEPGANDNGSGVAASVEALLALAEAAENGEALPCSVTLYLLPEFTGSILVASRRKRPDFVANLDMVGGREDDVGGNWFYAPPTPYIKQEIAEAFMLAKIAYYSEGIKLELKPFTAGSDHVPFIFSGASSFMVNQWPDKFYHSDYDDVDRISKTHLKASAASLAAILAARASPMQERENIIAKWFSEYYILKVAENHQLQKDNVAFNLALSTLKASLGLSFTVTSSGNEGLWEPWMKDSYPKLKLYPLMTPSQLVHIDLDTALKMAEIMQKERHHDAINLNLYTAVFVEPQLLADGTRSLAYIIEIISAEHGSRVASLIPKSLEILEEAGVIDLK